MTRLKLLGGILLITLMGNTCASPTPPTPTPPTPTPVVTIGPDGKEMVLVPAGEFLMGTSDDELAAFLRVHPDWQAGWLLIEQPQHRVYVDAFAIDRTEVTNAEYLRFVTATGHEPPPHWTDGQVPAGLADYPVVGIHWEDAQAYADWAGKRLPTEAEWEKAARGTDGRAYPWGHEWDPDQANVLGSARNGPAPVGSYPQDASPYGALDMAGNAWEWCLDWYAADYYIGSPLRNPQGPAEGTYHVTRGGSWFDIPEYARCAFRYGLDPRRLVPNQGFRCVMVP
ncbi:MAG: formylglycine-generating enzyme family protein [Chloroflexi bacterium]|nr:formylglycine-generating enzyme family protein [Chloroflexota bacterium]MBU1752105.1 formylglycine-generating enzyme family protein [Chloroflexota bacterium]MBU1877689.1 formylglycine-generating enzyme family protein [Chloroflexota bacterium]